MELNRAQVLSQNKRQYKAWDQGNTLDQDNKILSCGKKNEKPQRRLPLPWIPEASHPLYCCWLHSNATAIITVPATLFRDKIVISQVQ